MQRYAEKGTKGHVRDLWDPPGSAAAGFLFGGAERRTDLAVGGNLNEKQRRFVAAYVEGLDPHKAALAAGYKPRGARCHGERLLGQRPIVEAIARLAGGAPAPAASPPRTPITQTPITRAWITEELTDLYKTVKACLAGSGEPGGKVPSGASLQSVIKTLELLIKHLEKTRYTG